MQQGKFRIIENKALTGTTYRMVLAGDASAVSAPGQFINIKLDGHFLRRPISVCDAEGSSCESEYARLLSGAVTAAAADEGSCADGRLTIIYKILGQGTEEMSRLEPGCELDVLTGLGNGYDLSSAGERPLLIGGGVGIPPLYLAAKLLRGSGADVSVILGFNSADEIYYTEEFETLGCTVFTATADGSEGIKGFVTDAFRELRSDFDFSHFYCCGPEPMLRAVFKAVYEEAGISGQMSFEERMGCGFGACMGCSTRVKDGYKRICKDGPVLRTEEIVWQ